MYKGIHYKQHILSILSMHNVMAKVKVSASVNVLGCTVLVPLKYVPTLCMFCLVHECLWITWVTLEYKSQHVSDEKKTLIIFLKDL